MALSWETLQALLKEITTNVTNLKNIDFKNLTVKDVIVLLGTAYSLSKTVYGVISIYRTVKDYGVARMLKPNFKKFGAWAMVTGCTHGIGRAYAIQLAESGVNVLLVSRNQEKLNTLAEYIIVFAQSIEARYKVDNEDVVGAAPGVAPTTSESPIKNIPALVQVMAWHQTGNKPFPESMLTHICGTTGGAKTYEVETASIAVDFTEGQDVYEGIAAGIEGKEIGTLVNNVGVMYDLPQYFSEVSEEKLWQLIHVNIAAATMITHMVIPQMAQRKRGAVVIVTSGTSFLPTPLATVYSASKNYLEFLARALRYEYKPQGVTIQVLKPLAVAEGAGNLSSNRLVPTAEDYTKQAVRTLGWSDETAGCFSHTMQAWLAGFLPESTLIWISTMMTAGVRAKAQLETMAAEQPATK